MSEADKLFEELGYKKIIDGNDLIKYKLEEKDIEYYIEINKKYKTIVCFAKINKKGILQFALNVQELKAINLKCKELGWIEE